jgi:uncharacterized protein (TIGR03435 family)
MRGVSGRSWAPGYFDRPVIDLTGIEGSFDFTLGWTGKQRILDGRNRPAAAVPQGGVAVPSDPSGAITIFEAVERQLGLKVEAQKHPMPVLVIDHEDPQQPTDN